jgi:hypothetical protein
MLRYYQNFRYLSRTAPRKTTPFHTAFANDLEKKYKGSSHRTHFPALEEIHDEVVMGGKSKERDS